MTLAQSAGTDVNEGLELEEVVITGTSIRGIQPVGSTPVQYGREELEADAPSSIGDVLANIPQIASFGTEQQLSTTNRFRTAGFIPVIHNMEIGSTLTLFNGHRMAATGAEATFPDPSIIPTIAVESVQVVSDGNSAVYGSDAVAGVVNFLYRRNVDGFEVDLSTTQDPDSSYESNNIGLLWGKTFSSGEVMIAYEHAEHTAALQGEFPFIAEADHRPLGGQDRRTNTCNEPRIAIGATTYSGPSLAASTAANAYRCNPDTNLTLGFDNERDAVLATGRFRPTEGVEFWGELNYSDYSEPRYQNWANISVTVPNTSPYFWVPPGGTTATSQTVNVQAENIFGPRLQSATSKVSAVTLGASLDIGATWKTDVRVHYSWTDDYWDVLQLDQANLRALVASGQFNPYANSPNAVAGLNRTANSSSVIGQINNGFRIVNTGKQALTEIEVKADGPLFAIAGGDVKAAVGANHRTEELRQTQDAGCQQAGCSFFLRQRDDNIARGVNSAFLEVNAPFVSSANARSGLRELTLSLAGRYDKYDLLSGEFTPKVALNYKPIDSLSFHGSWGKSYAAPNLGLTTQTFAIVQLGMNIQGQSFDTYNLGGGNSALESENAETYSFGVDWKPDALPGLSAGATYYNVVYNNIIYKPGFDDLIFNPAFKNQRIVGNEATPTVPVVISPAVMAPIIAKYPPDTILAPGQTFHLVAGTYAINMYKRKFAGLDLNVRYDWDTNSLGKWGVGINANQQLVRETQIAPGAVVINDIGTFKAPEWQAQFRANWSGNTIPLSLSWVTNYLSAYKDTQVNSNGTVTLRNTDWLYGGDSSLIHNITAAYNFENLFKGVTLQLRVLNVTNEKPPLADLVVGYDDDNHSPYGTQYTLSVRAKF